MTTTMLPEAVDRAITVRLPPDEAWQLFTQHLRDWWPLARHSCSGDPRAEVVFEPRAGGAVVERAPDGTRHPWGTLTEWDPPRAFAMRWHPGQPADQATRLRVSFSGVPEGGTEVRVLHDGWQARGAEARQVRDQYDAGWPLVLHALRDAAARDATL